MCFFSSYQTTLSQMMIESSCNGAVTLLTASVEKDNVSLYVQSVTSMLYALIHSAVIVKFIKVYRSCHCNAGLILYNAVFSFVLMCVGFDIQ